MIKKCRKRPIVHECLQFTGDNYKECREFLGEDNYDNTLNYPNIKTLEGIMSVNKGSWILKGAEGEFWAVKESVFDKTYDIIDD